MRTITYEHRHNCSYAGQTVSIDVEEHDGYFVLPNAPRCVEFDVELTRTIKLVEEDEDQSHDEPADEESEVV